MEQFIPQKLTAILHTPIKIVFWRDEKFNVTTIDIFEDQEMDEVEVKINYHDFPENFDELSHDEQEYWVFQDNQLFEYRYDAKTEYDDYGQVENIEVISPDYSINIEFDIFTTDPKRWIEEFINKMAREILESRISIPTLYAKIRVSCLNDGNKDALINDLSFLRGKNFTDEQKSVLIAQLFFLIGFEVFPIEELKAKYNEIQNMLHPDIVAYYPPTNTIFLVEEMKKFGTENFAKFETPILNDVLINFIDIKNKLTIYFLIIGKVSEDIELPTRINIIVIPRNEFIAKFEQILHANPESKNFTDLVEAFYKILKLKKLKW